MLQQQTEEKMVYEKSYGIVPVHEDHGVFLFLLVHEKAGHWGIPKGHPNEKESELETARREFIEETSIVDFQVIEGPSFVERYCFKNDGVVFDKTVKYFIARVPETKVTVDLDEIIGYGWFNYQEALEMVIHEGRKNIIHEAKEYADKYFKKDYDHR